MTIVLFLVDTSASMAQKSYLGTSLLDFAKAAVETFLKQRARDPSARGDRYMLMTLEEFPKNVKAGWREGQAIFHEQLKGLKPRGLTTFGPALGESLRFLNLNRMQSGIDNYGCGRYPYYLEPAIIIAITDGNSLTTNGTTNEIALSKPTAIGNELTEEPFRWDQRIFSLVLRLPGHAPKTKFIPGSALPTDSGSIDAMCAATGGRSYCITSHKMLYYCIESLVQKLLQQGVVVKLEKYGADPVPLIANHEERIGNNGVVENGFALAKDVKEEVKVNGEETPAWHQQLCMLISRASRAYPGHWPIPEAFWPETVTSTLPLRKAHPVLQFRCEPCEPLVCHEFPFDKYELEPSPLTQFILDRKQPNYCWQVFVSNSGRFEGLGFPFGYLKASSTVTSVNLVIMPYNYPVLLPLLEEAKQEVSKGRPSLLWKQRFDKYLKTVPFYYFQPLRKALQRMNLGAVMPESDQQYGYGVLSYLTKIKHNARDDIDRACQAVSSRLPATTAVTGPEMVAVKPRNPVSLTSRPELQLLLNNATAETVQALKGDVNEFHGFKVALSESSNRPGPSALFRNPFDIPREKLIDQLRKMRINLEQQLKDTKIPVLEGGRPGTRLKLQHAEDLHNLPVSLMGIYQDYVKQLELTGKAPLREVEPQAIRQHAFGNPFKLDKKNMLVDEVGEGTLLTGSSSGSKQKRPGTPESSSGDSSKSLKSSSAPPRRKAGPLPNGFRREWRRRRRRRLSSAGEDDDDLSSLASDTESVISDTDSTPSLFIDDEEQPSSSNADNQVADWPPVENGREPSLEHANNYSETNHIAQMDKPKATRGSRSPPPRKVARKARDKPSLTPDQMSDKLDQITTKLRRPGTAASAPTLLSTLVTLSPVDQTVCLQHAVEQAKRFKRVGLVDVFNKELDKLRKER